MGQIVLRPYQQEAVDRSIQGFTSGVDGEPASFRLLGVMATGGGKTVVFSFLADYFVKNGQRVLILVDQIELAYQARAKLLETCGIYAQIEQGDNRATLEAQVVIGSIQTMSGRGLLKYPADHFGLVVADEADRSLSDDWQKVLDHYASACQLGVTATPFRGDKKSLMPRWKQVAFNVPMVRLINEGYLAQIEAEQLPIEIDLSSIHQQGGDFDRDELDAVLAPTFDRVCQKIKERAADRKKILVFQPLRVTSLRFVQACARAGLDARHVDGSSKERDATLEWFHADTGGQKILSNAMLLQRGWDEPAVDCVCIMRPTRSRSAYWQMVGRGTRLWCPHRCPCQCEHPEAKRNLLLLDFLWQHGKIAPMRPADLIAETVEQAAAITKRIAREDGKPINILRADSEAAREAEMMLLQQMEAAAKNRPGNLLPAAEFGALAHRLDVAEYEPVSESDARPPSDKQKKLLEQLGVNPDTVKYSGQASVLIGMAMERKVMGLASVKQIRLLRKFGVKYPEMVNRENARIYQDYKMSRGRHRLPAGFDLYAPPRGSAGLVGVDGQPLQATPDRQRREEVRAEVKAQPKLDEYDPDPYPERGPDLDDSEPVAPEKPAPAPPAPPKAPGSDFRANFAAIKQAVRAVQTELF